MTAKTYDVCLPITGHIWIKVVADNEKQAIGFAMESPCLCLENVEEWSAHEAIVTGNVYHASVNEAYAVELKGESCNEASIDNSCGNS